MNGDMNGQWIGPYAGTSAGLIVADLDATKDGYAGHVSVFDHVPGRPIALASITIPKNLDRFSLQAQLKHVERGSGASLSLEQLAEKFPGFQFPTSVDTSWEVSSKQISVNWKTNIGTNGTGWMTRSEGNSPSILTAVATIKSWAEFKEHVLTLEPWRFAFRGQENATWRLRTYFHRTGRANLMRFITEDVPALHRHLSGLTPHLFDLSSSLDYAAFLNLVQHHGYPTPILDWTQSPFVAAYFAFQGHLSRSTERGDQKVRIFCLDMKAWNASFEKATVLMPGYLHVTVLEPLAINNPRLVPQQSVSTVTNIDDIETYIRGVETKQSKSFLSAIDLPAVEGRKVMHELALMGITAGTLFPGLEGACRQLKERFFDLY